MSINIIKNENLSRFISAVTNLKIELLDERIHTMEQSISFGDTEKDIALYRQTLEDLSIYKEVSNNLKFYTECFLNSVEKSKLLNEAILDIDKKDMLLTVKEEDELVLINNDRVVLSILNLKKNWLINLVKLGKLKFSVKLFDYNYEEEIINIQLFKNKIQNNEKAIKLGHTLNILNKFERYFDIISIFSLLIDPMASSEKLDTNNIFLVFKNNKFRVTLDEFCKLSFYEIILNYYDWKTAFNLSNTEELKVFLKNISKIKKYFIRKKIIPCVNFDFSDYFKASFISVYYGKNEEIYLRIDKDVNIDNILDCELMKQEKNEKLEKTEFRYSDYLFNKDEVLHYINMIDY